MKTASKYSLLLLLLWLSSYPTTAQVTQYEQINLQIRKTATAASNDFRVTDAVQLVRFFMQQNGIARCESDLSNHKFKLVARPGVDLKLLLTNANMMKALNQLGYEIIWTSEPNFAYDSTPKRLANSDYLADNPTPNAPIFKGLATEYSPPKTTTAAKTSSKTSRETRKMQKMARAAQKAQQLAAQKAAMSALKQMDDKPATFSISESSTAPSSSQTIEANSNKDAINTTIAAPCDNCGEQKVSNDLRDDVLKNANYETDAIDFGGDLSSPEGDFEQETPSYSNAQLDSLRQVLLKDNSSPK